MVDYTAQATTPVTMAELRRGELATEKTMRAYRSSTAAANVTTVMRGSWQSWRSAGWSHSVEDAEMRARELTEAATEARRRR